MDNYQNDSPDLQLIKNQVDDSNNTKNADSEIPEINLENAEYIYDLLNKYFNNLNSWINDVERKAATIIGFCGTILALEFVFLPKLLEFKESAQLMIFNFLNLFEINLSCILNLFYIVHIIFLASSFGCAVISHSVTKYKISNYHDIVSKFKTNDMRNKKESILQDISNLDESTKNIYDILLYKSDYVKYSVIFLVISIVSLILLLLTVYWI